MKIVLHRQKSSDKSTIGTIYIDGKFECYSLEDIERPEKIKGETAIPAGTYKVVLTQSPRFGRILPLLVDVPNYEGIRIHPGNTDKDTDGCILPGQSQGKDFVGNSRLAFDALFAKLQAAKDPITIEIRSAS